MRKNVAVIPARLASTRLPRKVLAEIEGQPLLWHVWSQVSKAVSISSVVVATDSEEVQAIVQGWGGRVLMTSPDCRSGTERIASVLSELDDDLVINVQGDEPLVDPIMLDSLVEKWSEQPSDLITPVYRISCIDDLHNPNVVKVVRAGDGTALYFSRSPVPFLRDVPAHEWLQNHTFWGHIGVYGYRREILARYFELPISGLEMAEKLEQLRFLEAGYRFQTVETSYRPVAVDTAEDLEKVRLLLAAKTAVL